MTLARHIKHFESMPNFKEPQKLCAKTILVLPHEI